MKEGLGVMYDARTQSLYKGYFVKDRFSHPVSDNSDTPDNKPLLNPSPRPVVQDGRFHYKGLTNISLSYGLGQILSIHVHYHISDWFFAGGQLGLNMANYGIGEVSETTNDDTGEKVTLVEWDSYMDEVLTEIEAIVASGMRLDLNYYIREHLDEEVVEEIFDWFRDEAQSDSLEEAIKALGADYEEEEIRLVRIKFLCEVAN